VLRLGPVGVLAALARNGCFEPFETPDLVSRNSKNGLEAEEGSEHRSEPAPSPGLNLHIGHAVVGRVDR